LIGRDAHGIDPRLRDHLGASGVELTLLESGEYRQMMSPPEIPFTPTATIAASVDWLRSLTARAPLPPASSEAGAPSKRRRPFGSRDSRTRRTVEFEHEGVRVRESVTQLRSDAGRLVGVITEPAGARSGSHCMVVVNSGALRNTGPNRMFVEIARGAAARGVPTARFDLPGLGDSDGVPIKSFERTADDDDESLAWLAQIYDHVQQLGVADRLVAGGFSLGGYLAIRAVLNDPRLIGAISVNPTGLTWTDKQRKRVIRDLIALAGPEAVTPRRAPGAPRGARHRVRERLARACRSVEAQVRRRLAEYDVLWCLEHRAELAGVRHTLDQLDATGRRAVLMLSENEQLLRMLDRPRIAAELARRPSIAVERLPNDDHLLRPLWVQELIIDRFCSALVQLGSAAPSEGPSRANATRRSFGEV
jgi:dienelactone hydrolase